MFYRGQLCELDFSNFGPQAVSSPRPLQKNPIRFTSLYTAIVALFLGRKSYDFKSTANKAVPFNI